MAADVYFSSCKHKGRTVLHSVAGGSQVEYTRMQRVHSGDYLKRKGKDERGKKKESQKC